LRAPTWPAIATSYPCALSTDADAARHPWAADLSFPGSDGGHHSPAYAWYTGC
jgi:hypothetical protein